MDLSDINDQPAELTNLLPKTRQNGDTKEFTAQFKVAFNYGHKIFEMLAVAGEDISVSFLWDDEGRPIASIPYVPFSREFAGYRLEFHRNKKAVLSFPAEKLHKFRVTPKANEVLEVSFLAFGLTSSKANSHAIHQIIKDPSITMSIEQGAGQAEM